MLYLGQIFCRLLHSWQKSLSEKFTKPLFVVYERVAIRDICVTEMQYTLSDDNTYNRTIF